MEKRRVFVVGIGMSKFIKPKKTVDAKGPRYEDLVETAVTNALYDAQLQAKDIDHAACGRLSETGGTAQRSLHRLGFHSIPLFNVSNACASGSNALYFCRQLIISRQAECALAVGVEEMAPGALSLPANRSLDDHIEAMGEKVDIAGPPMPPQMFAAAAREHMALFGSTARQFAMVGEKKHRHSQHNPYSQFRDVYSVEQVQQSAVVSQPITKLQCSPTSDGAAAAVICSEDFVKKHGFEGQAVEILGQCMTTHGPEALKRDSTARDVVGFEMAKRCANGVYKEAGVTADNVDVVELHDCFSANEIFTYEAMQLCKEGEGGKFVESGAPALGGEGPICNPSGGLISKGHPIGATGVAQCCELNWQLRGECGPRQVKGRGGRTKLPKVALQHNLGLPGQIVCTLYSRPEEWLQYTPKRPSSGALGAPQMSKL